MSDGGPNDFSCCDHQKLAISYLNLRKCIQLHIKILPSGFSVSELIKKLKSGDYWLGTLTIIAFMYVGSKKPKSKTYINTGASLERDRKYYRNGFIIKAK